MVMVSVIEFDESMLGKNVTIVTLDGVSGKGFKPKTQYKGRLLDRVDWLVGCPVFECETGILGVGYECKIIAVR